MTKGRVQLKILVYLSTKEQILPSSEIIKYVRKKEKKTYLQGYIIILLNQIRVLTKIVYCYYRPNS